MKKLSLDDKEETAQCFVEIQDKINEIIEWINSKKDQLL